MCAARALDDVFGVSTVGVEETSLRKGQKYIALARDLQAKRLLFACEGRDHQTVADFASDLKAHSGEPAQIEHVCQDMSGAYGMAQAQISDDRFHVIAIANEPMDGVRRLKMKEEPQAVKEALGDNERKLLKSLTWDMRRNPRGWSAGQTRAMHWLQRSTLKSAQASRLKSAHASRLKRALRAVYARAAQDNCGVQSKVQLLNWISWARRS